jgi:hypothetical protein
VRKYHATKAMLIGLVLLLLYYDLFVKPNVYRKLWFAIVWSAIAAIAVVRSEGKGWTLDVLKLRSDLQFVLSCTLILATVVATDWGALGTRDIIQAGYTFWLLVGLYREGCAWAWSRIKALMSLGTL